MRRPGARWAAAAIALAAAGGCGGKAPPAPRPPGPAVILVTLDTFRADHLGCAGHPDVRTPHLDALARGATQWTGAVSAVPLTTPSHATILTGLTARAHGVLKNRMVLPERVRTIAEILKEAGWRTGAVVSSPVVLGPELGLSAGFDSYEVVEPAERPARGEGRHTTEAARRWLAEHGGRGSFLWAHYFDAHLPYVPPDPLPALYDPDYEGPFALPTGPVQAIFSAGDGVTARDVAHLAALYAAEVTFLDRCVGELLRAPEAAGAVVLVTADHGEGLWEHERYFGHDVLLYDTAIRVPLILRAEGAGAAAARAVGPAAGPPRDGGLLSREPARTTDVAPTLLGLCGVDPGPMEGRDLLRDPGPEGDGLALVLETHPSEEKAEPIFGLRTETEKVIWVQRERRHEYYDLAADPAERRDLGDDAGELYRMLAGDLEIDLRERPPGRPRTVDDEHGMDDATREALESLGYVTDTAGARDDDAPAGRGDASGGAPLPDPKDMIRVQSLIYDSMRAMTGGRWDDARRDLQRALQRDPHNKEAHKVMGMLYAEQGLDDLAVDSFRQAMEVGSDADDDTARIVLAAALMRLGLYEEAGRHFEILAGNDPLNADAWFNHGQSLRAQDRKDEAIAAFRRALELKPDLEVAREALIACGGSE